MMTLCTFEYDEVQVHQDGGDSYIFFTVADRRGIRIALCTNKVILYGNSWECKHRKLFVPNENLPVEDTTPTHIISIFNSQLAVCPSDLAMSYQARKCIFISLNRII